MLTLGDAASIHRNLFFRRRRSDSSCWLPSAALLRGLFLLRSCCSLSAPLWRSLFLLVWGLRILRRYKWLDRHRVFQWFFWLVVSRTLFFHWAFSSLWSDLFDWGLLGFYWLSRFRCLGLQLDGDCFSGRFAGCAFITRWQSWFLLSFFNWSGSSNSAFWSYFLNWGSGTFRFGHHSLFEVALGLRKTFLSRLGPWWGLLYGTLAFELASHSRLLSWQDWFASPTRVSSGCWSAWSVLCDRGSSRWLLFVSHLLSASWWTLLLSLCTSLGFGGSFLDLFLQFGLSQR